MPLRNRRKRGWYDAFMDAGIWVLFFALLVPAGAVGYVIGEIRRYTSGESRWLTPSS